MTSRLVVVVDLEALRYSTVQVRVVINQDEAMDYFDETVLGCSKVGNWRLATRYAITGYYINQVVMTAMYRAMVGERDPMVALARVMACELENRYAKADYHYEIAVEAKRDAMTRDVKAQDVMMARDCQLEDGLFE